MYKRGKWFRGRCHSKAIELFQPASVDSLANAYKVTGNGVKQQDMNMKKADHLCQKAAMMGHNGSGNNLGVLEEMAGNHDRAIRHICLQQSVVMMIRWMR
eukprot:scaffold166478_cov106-Cyclotella_meneghiniana.AAC.1